MTVVVVLGMLLGLEKAFMDISNEGVVAAEKAVDHLCGSKGGGGWPYTTSNGVVRSVVWKEVL
jgi:hypothetical protein